ATGTYPVRSLLSYGAYLQADPTGYDGAPRTPLLEPPEALLAMCRERLDAPWFWSGTCIRGGGKQEGRAASQQPNVQRDAKVGPRNAPRSHAAARRPHATSTGGLMASFQGRGAPAKWSRSG